MLELSKEAMGDFRRTAFRRKPRSGGSDEQPEEETGEFSWGALGALGALGLLNTLQENK